MADQIFLIAPDQDFSRAQLDDIHQLCAKGSNDLEKQRQKKRDPLSLPPHQQMGFLDPDVSDRIAVSYFKELLNKRTKRSRLKTKLWNEIKNKVQFGKKDKMVREFAWLTHKIVLCFWFRSAISFLTLSFSFVCSKVPWKRTGQSCPKRRDKENLCAGAEGERKD